MRIVLLRHGQTPSNVDGLLDTGEPGPGLTELGRAQAQAVPAALAGQRVDRIFASSLVRTQQTAAPLAQERGIEPEILPGFREVEAGALEMSNAAQDQRTYLGTAFAWSRGELDQVMPGGPDGHAFFSRYDDAVAQAAAATDGTAVIFSHGAAIRSWAAGRVRGLPVESCEGSPLFNTGYVVAEGDPESGWDLVEFHHLPAGGEALLTPAAEDPTGAGTAG